MNAEQQTEPVGGTTTAAERPLGSRAPRFVQERRPLHLSWQAGVFLIGLAVVIAGVIMLVIPGPGWLVIFAGMAIWATEFVWAQLVMRWTRRKLHDGREWLRHRRAERAARKRS
jgi:uncharacterized protein (TIGR02611 family)